MINQWLMLASLTLFSTCCAVETEIKQLLIGKALEARGEAYAPYSNYRVGCALLLKDGSIVKGANVENSSYGLTCCAERVALFSSIANGKREFAAAAIATKDGGSPCGACRQVMNEFNPEMYLIIVNDQGEVKRECLLIDILPNAFGPHNLQ